VPDPELREQFLRAATARLPAPYRLSPRRAAAARYGGLSPREREVAALIARGLTNRQIAEALVLSEGTVENYVQRIMGKLGFNRRAQIAAWAVEHGLGRAPR
jgi:DNA-binding NarL/FixJ family response regulator